MPDGWDVIVVGAGNAGLCAAHAASEAGASVLVLDAAPTEWLGGNSYFTAGAIRTVHGGVPDLLDVLEDRGDERLAVTDLESYGQAEFRADMLRVTRGRCDPELTDVLVEDSRPTIAWLHRHGLRFRLMYERQAYESAGRQRFWGGLALGTVDGGRGLLEQHLAEAARAGVEVRAAHAVTELLLGADGGVEGVACRVAGTGRAELGARAVVAAAGGFEADPRRRAAHLGPGWDLAKVRGTPYNTGVVLDALLAAGAQAHGHWSGCHAIAWDAGAPATGDRELTNRFSRQSYPFGIVVNVRGERFLDEGADFRNYTYARYGAEILRQPDALAAQIFDARSARLLREEDYDARRRSARRARRAGGGSRRRSGRRCSCGSRRPRRGSARRGR